jgi:hypothetical protein
LVAVHKVNVQKDHIGLGEQHGTFWLKEQTARKREAIIEILDLLSFFLTSSSQQDDEQWLRRCRRMSCGITGNCIRLFIEW